MYPFSEQILAYRAQGPDRRIGGLILEVKGDFCGKVQDILARHGCTALARGDDPEQIIHQIAQDRATDKTNPEIYARHTVEKAQTDLEDRLPPKSSAGPQTTQGTNPGQDRNELPLNQTLIVLLSER